jgi:hypothetical protein
MPRAVPDRPYKIAGTTVASLHLVLPFPDSLDVENGYGAGQADHLALPINFLAFIIWEGVV